MDPLVNPARLGVPFTEEQVAIGQIARRFGEERLAAGAAERDRTGEFPTEFLPELAELGLMAMKVPVEDGGSGIDNVGYTLAMAGIAEACTSCAVILAVSNLTTWILGEYATPAQKERFLRPYAEWKLGPASFALTEPHCGSDAAAMRTTARRDGDSYVLDGGKMWITSGAFAGLHIVFAKTSPDLGPKGISAFIVEKGTPGLHVGREEDKMGQRASGTVALHFESCRVPAANLLGQEGEGYKIALKALGGGRIGIAAVCIGIAETAYADGVKYASERMAFNQPVLDFQNSRFLVADARTRLDAAWLLALRSAVLVDRDGSAAVESSMAKLYASEACDFVVDAMLQLHGGYGYSREYRIERLYRDSRVTRIYEGSSEIQRLVIGREIAKSAGR